MPSFAAFLLSLFTLSTLAVAQDDEAEYRRRVQASNEAFDAGRYDEVIAINKGFLDDEDLDEQRWGIAAYNVACAYSLGGEIDTAFEWLTRSLEFGNHATAEHILGDDDLANLREDERFALHVRAVEEQLERDREEAERGMSARRAALEEGNRRVRDALVVWLDGSLGAVYRVRMSPDGERAVTWAEDGSAWLWNTWTGEPIGLLGTFGRADNVGRWDFWPVPEFSADGERILLLERMSGVAGLWDGRSAEFLGYLEAGRQVLREAVFDPEGRRVATADETGMVRLFEADLGTPIPGAAFEAEGVRYLSFSPDGARLMAHTARGRAHLWDCESGEELAVLGSPGPPLWRVCFSQDGTRVLGMGVGMTGLVYDVREPSGQPIEPSVSSARGESWKGVDWGTGGDAGGDDILFTYVRTPRVRPRGDRFVAVAGDGSASLWDPASGEEVAALDGCEIAIQGNVGNSWLGFSPDGTRLLTLQRERALLWNAETGERVADLSGDFWAWHGVFSPSGRRLALAYSSSSGNGVRMVDASTGQLVGDLPLVGESPVLGMHFDLRDRLAVAAGVALVWDGTTPPVLLRPHVGAVTGPPVQRSQGFGTGPVRRQTCLSPDGLHAVSVASTSDGYALRVWDLRTGETIREQRAPDWINAQFLESGELFVAGRGDFTIGVVQPGGAADRAGLRVGDRLLRLAGVPVVDMRTLTRARDAAPERTTVTLLRDGREIELPIEFTPGPNRRLGQWAGSPTVLELQDAESGVAKWSIELEPGPALFRPIPHVAASRVALLSGSGAVLYDLSNGRRLALLGEAVALSPTADIAASWRRSNELQLHDLSTGFPRETLPGCGFARTFVFSPDGSLLAGDGEGASVWDLLEGGPPRRFTGHQGNVWGRADRDFGLRGGVPFVAFDPDGRRLVTAGFDGTANIWDLAQERDPIVLGGHGGSLNVACFSPDGLRVLTTSEDGTARLWDASSGSEIAVLEGHVGPVMWGEFSARGDRILTQSLDGSTRIWDGVDGRQLAARVDYDDGWVVFEPGGYFIAGGNGAERARRVVHGRRYPLSSYAAIYESPEKVAQSLAGETVRAPSFVPRAPELRIAAPLDTVVQERAFRFEVLVDDTYGIEGVTVEQDGVLCEAPWVSEHLALATGSRTARLSCELTVPEGETATTVRVRARNVRKILSPVDSVHVRYEAPRRELFVLAIGVADYEDDSLDLAYPAKDVDDLIARFQSEEGGFYAKVNVQRLVDGEVTPGKLRKAREEFLLRAEPEDTIIVFAAGHGVRSDSGEYYFLTPGTTPDEPYDGIERQVLESLVTWDRLHADRRILLLDTCHSGEAFGEGKRGVAMGSFDQQEVDEAAGSGLYIIAASSEAGFAQEMEGNGLFTRAVIEGLDGAADADGDGLVGIEELKTYVTASVHERSAGRQRPTAPRIEGGENFPLARVK